MARGYGQYCPLAITAEVLGERWTLLVVSRLMDGCTRFNEIHRGVPRMSATLLAQRLETLVHAGIAERRPVPGLKAKEYHLTDAGWELEPIVMTLASWGQRWGRDMKDDDLDPAFLAWSMHLRLNTDAMPEGRTVMEFQFTGAPKDCQRFWLMANDGVAEMCDKNPGYETDLTIMTDLRLFVEAWRGIRSLRRELAQGTIRLQGPDKLKRAFPSWMLLSMIAPEPRVRPGKEKEVSDAARQTVQD